MSSQNTEDPMGNQDIDLEFKPIGSIEKLRTILGKPAKALEKRVQTTLDYYCTEFIELASAAVLATTAPEQPMHFIDCQQESPFIVNPQRLSLSQHFTKFEFRANAHHASLYFFIAGVGHTLRANGKLIKTEHATVEFHIDALYFHCARAAARAQLWQGPAFAKEPKRDEITTHTTTAQFLRQSPFLLLKTLTAEGTTEVSPRGDGAGFVHQLSPTALLIPERPGNKVAVSLSNLIAQPKVELLCVIPGCHWLLSIIGEAVITDSPALLEHCIVKGKRPKLGILIEIASASIQQDKILSDMQLWDSKNRTDSTSLTPFSKALSAHINGTGFLGKITSGVVKAVVNHDMKNLY
ncbi:MAG: pyridoxamine 5'-phosphate oxidase family protein [Cellvibrionaceae bacterium]